MPGLVLEHPCEESGALDLDRVAVGVGAGDLRPIGATRRELLAGNGQATLEVFVRVGHRLGDFGRLEYRVHDDAASTLAAAVVTGAVVDEDSQWNTDLIGRQTDAVGSVHRLVHVCDQFGDLGRGLSDRLCRLVQYRVADDSDGEDSHADKDSAARPRSYHGPHTRSWFNGC